jgi:DNA-directed RNA polymerase subunit delta
LVRASEERATAAPASLSDSLESGPLSEPGGALESDSGLEQSGDELELPARRHSLRHEPPDFDEDDIDLDQEISGINSDEEDEEEDGDDDRDEANEDDSEAAVDKKREEEEGRQRQQRPSRIPSGVLLREDLDEADLARLEDEMSEPEDGLHEDEPADSDAEEPLGKEKESTKDAITQMLSRLVVEGGPDYMDRRDLTIR